MRRGSVSQKGLACTEVTNDHSGKAATIQVHMQFTSAPSNCDLQGELHFFAVPGKVRNS